jgi:choline dehydrogenase
MGNPNSYNDFLQNKLDFNDWNVVKNDQPGVFPPPLTRLHGFRSGLREHILQTAAQLPNNLVIMTNSLVSRVLFDGRKAIGVEYMPGAHLYRASPLTPNGPGPAKQQLLCKREVIIAGGTFNSPQILKLSGVGPDEELRQFGIKTVVDLPGVGENLQDRYEISVISQLKNFFTMAQGCTFLQGNDPCFAQLVQQGDGFYSSMGSAIAGITKSSPQQPDRDLLLIFATAPFKGWYPGWEGPVLSTPNQFSWLILKAHTLDRAGTVKLRSADPRDTPAINFHFFNEGTDKAGVDLGAVVKGIQIARSMNQDLQNIITQEVYPGPAVQTVADIANFAQNQSWGHHASCSNKMGPSSDKMAVVDSNFRVHGTEGLRVVDASVFPRIPGYFVMLPIFMISEKASDVILRNSGDQDN